MLRDRTLLAALRLGLFSTLAAAPVRAQTWLREAATLHVVERLHVPGAVLEPGTYRIRVVDEQSDRNVVQITDLGERKVYATMIATPHVAARPRPDAEFVFDRDADGNPMALRSWWAPDDRYGQDFVYDREETAELARLAERVPPAPEPVSSAVYASNPPKAAPAVAPAVKVSQPAAVAATNAAPAKMPHTASPVPLVALSGLAALAAAAALRVGSRHAA